MRISDWSSYVCSSDLPDLLFASSHQWPFYPGTGARRERGEFDNVSNLPLTAFSGSAEFRQGMTDIVLPAVDRFGPELILISAGSIGKASCKERGCKYV